MEYFKRLTANQFFTLSTEQKLEHISRSIELEQDTEKLKELVDLYDRISSYG